MNSVNKGSSIKGGNRNSDYNRIYVYVDMVATGKHIHDLIERSGISINDICSATGITTKQAIYRWYKGRTLPSLENMLILKKLLGLESLEELLVIDVSCSEH